MILSIIQAPDARLLQPSLPVGTLSTILGELFGALIDTRIEHDGVGLSAVQIGVHLRVCSVDPVRFGGFRLLINPVVVRHDGDAEVLEGCLSIGHGKPRFKVRRAKSVLLSFVDIHAEDQRMVLHGFSAAVAQHEIDHMDGRLIA